MCLHPEIARWVDREIRDNLWGEYLTETRNEEVDAIHQRTLNDHATTIPQSKHTWLWTKSDLIWL